jgi:hypothetical protein
MLFAFWGSSTKKENKQTDAAKVFLEHDDVTFAKKFETLVRAAYQPLFETFGDAAWTIGKDKLIGFFRTADETSLTVGSRQANTFTTLAELAGHGQAQAEPKSVGAPTARRRGEAVAKAKPTRKGIAAKSEAHTEPPAIPQQGPARAETSQPSLTVRIEVNLPVTDDQEVYDKIFRSIRENLIGVPDRS